MNPRPVITQHIVGKLILSGEWGVLCPGNGAIIVPTRGIVVQAEPAEQICISSAAYGLERVAYTDLQHMQTATAQFLVVIVQAALDLLVQRGVSLNPFHLVLENDSLTYLRHRDGRLLKLGVGSSASAAVGTIKIITTFHGIQLAARELFAVASAAHHVAQGKQGSGCDVAVAATGQVLLFKRGEHVEDCQLKPLVLPPSWHLAVGFAGVSAKTADLVVLFNQARLEHGAALDALLKQIEEVVQRLAATLEYTDLGEALACMHENRQLLKKLSDLCGGHFETPALTQMIELANDCGAAAKFSGAGGGDCVIALCPSAAVKEAVHAAWSAHAFVSVSAVLTNL